MIKVCDDIGVVLDNGGSVVLVLLDFSKAFDTISHRNLCYKLEQQFGFGSDASYLIRSYLANRYQTVFINDSFSDSIPIFSGVPQGSVLGPILFSLYINDLPAQLIGCQIHLFADDVQVHFDCSGLTKEAAAALINRNLSRIAIWASENTLILNSRKTQACFISRSSINQEPPDIFLNETPITYSNNVISLGVTIQNNFEWDSFINKQCGKIYATLRNLRFKASFLSTSTKLKLFKSLIYPHFLFCDFVLTQASAYIINRLKVALNCCVRFVYSLSRFASVSHLQCSLIGCSFNKFPLLRSVLLLHNFVAKQLPNYIAMKLVPLRSQRGRKFLMPRPRTSYYYNSLLVRGIAYWNDLPAIIQTTNSSIRFKKACLEHFT